jgi:hypothetical protein
VTYVSHVSHIKQRLFHYTAFEETSKVMEMNRALCAVRATTLYVYYTALKGLVYFSRNYSKGTCKFSPLITAWGRRGIAPLIRNLGTRWGMVDFTPLPYYPREITALCIELEAGWASEPLPGLKPRIQQPLAWSLWS